MGDSTQPVFIIGSGRSGTRAMFKLFSGMDGVESHHEYCCTHIQQAAALYSMGRSSLNDIKQSIKSIHGSAIHYSEARIWIDCSHKLSRIINPLVQAIPAAKFVLITRDGRKVASSFFHKLAHEMYDDRSMAIISRWLSDTSLPQPPPERKYWWNIPQPGEPFHGELKNFDQFQRCCYHWSETNRIALESLDNHVASSQRALFKLEHIVSQPDTLRELCSFIGVEFSQSLFSQVQRPEGVLYPMDFHLTGEQRIAFETIAGKMQSQLGYGGDEYEMRY